MKRKNIISIVLPIVVFIVIIAVFFIKNNSDKRLLKSYWDLDLPRNYNVEIIYESERGFTGDGNRIYKVESKNNDEKVECFKCSNLEETDVEREVIDEILQESKMEDTIKVENLEFVESIKENEISATFFRTLVISYDRENNVYYIFERKI